MYRRVARNACRGDTSRFWGDKYITYLLMLCLSDESPSEHCANGPKCIEETRIPWDSRSSAKVSAAAFRLAKDMDARGEPVSA
jgi:hypothetical protein